MQSPFAPEEFREKYWCATHADSRLADLQTADLQTADLQTANLQNADLHTADLQTFMQATHLNNIVKSRFNKPLYNEVLGITNDILQPGQNYSKMYGTEL